MPAKTYGQYCPIAKASEVLGERWSVLVMRELLIGSRKFNDIARGLPEMSRTLLTKLGAKDRTQAVVFAIERGIIHFDDE